MLIVISIIILLTALFGTNMAVDMVHREKEKSAVGLAVPAVGVLLCIAISTIGFFILLFLDYIH